MVTNLNLNFKFLFNVKFGSWAFRNCAYFVMKLSGCDTVRLGVQLNPYYGRVFSWPLSPGAHVPDLAKLASQRPHMARQSSFLCSGASIRWYGTRTNRQKHTRTDHGGYRTEKVTKIRWKSKNDVTNDRQSALTVVLDPKPTSIWSQYDLNSSLVHILTTVSYRIFDINCPRFWKYFFVA